MFQESLPKTLHDNEDDRDQYLGEYPSQRLVRCRATYTIINRFITTGTDP